MRAVPYRSWMRMIPCLALALCLYGQAQAKMIDGIVAVVDNRIIMDSDLQKRMVELGAPANSKVAERQVLELMVEDIVIEKIYKSMGLPQVRESEARKVAEEAKLSLETARIYLMKNTLMEMMVRARVVITENMIKSYYDSRPEYKGKESVRLKQIIVTEDEAKVQKVMEELKSGTSFDDAAKAHSDILPPGGPDIGWIPIEDLSDEVMKHVATAKAGDTVGPIAIKGGQAVYQIVEKRFVGKRSYDEVREEIRTALEKKYQQEAFNYWLRKMMTQYFIGIYI
ncbi:MAG TPA: peptidyl-prolyl cis-trans isomerase [Deltaproteobacteria bacterium]|nr:peptidyl-prolyl cis-trans isomerase [Deltaproteobacteria bacterium]HOI06150.1 peptidyl-prolyl cis-trans isomerase [Deltaproteobacteria bacterium]